MITIYPAYHKKRSERQNANGATDSNKMKIAHSLLNIYLNLQDSKKNTR